MLHVGKYHFSYEKLESDDMMKVYLLIQPPTHIQKPTTTEIAQKNPGNSVLMNVGFLEYHMLMNDVDNIKKYYTKEILEYMLWKNRIPFQKMSIWDIIEIFDHEILRRYVEKVECVCKLEDKEIDISHSSHCNIQVNEMMLKMYFGQELLYDEIYEICCVCNKPDDVKKFWKILKPNIEIYASEIFEMILQNCINELSWNLFLCVLQTNVKFTNDKMFGKMFVYEIHGNEIFLNTKGIVKNNILPVRKFELPENIKIRNKYFMAFIANVLLPFPMRFVDDESIDYVIGNSNLISRDIADEYIRMNHVTQHMRVTQSRYPHIYAMHGETFIVKSKPSKNLSDVRFVWNSFI